MALLWLITALWAFSFSLIGVYLAGQVDAYLAVASRMALALLVFLPFIRATAWRRAVELMAIGAVQIGIMYLFLYHAFGYLRVPELLLFTVFTPLYVSLFADLWARRRPRGLWLPALLAVAGAAVIRWAPLGESYWTGFLLIQAANACFALGQIWYRQRFAASSLAVPLRFGWFFLGALLVTGLAAVWLADWSKVPQTASHWTVLLWLGLVASGLGYLGWNSGATLVQANQLAVMNNMLVPAGIAVNVLIWDGQIEPWPFLAGSALLLLSLVLCGRRPVAAQ
ncbi:EamA family transporter [Gallaecimonas sp. GXIMD4217]|uniref:EamA family transporter n=1 Tax=Gallaecimonas sp. GXIMD4217 TaxID=3131927 RepID=UPI00311B15A3